jgi:hypothetical protein
MFEVEISSTCHPGLKYDQAIFHDYLRQKIETKGNSDSKEWAEAWQFISYAMPKDHTGLQNRDSVPVRGIFVHGLHNVTLQSFQRILEGIPGVKVT